MLEVNARIAIPDTEFDFTYARSSGPGGQNVNKVNSKATLHWHVVDSPSVPPDVRARFLKRYATRINREGFLVLSSERYRDQPRNAADCLNKLRDLLLTVAVAPKPRRKTRPTKASKERRLQGKHHKGQKKQSRGGGWKAE